MGDRAEPTPGSRSNSGAESLGPAEARRRERRRQRRLIGGFVLVVVVVVGLMIFDYVHQH